MSPSQIAALRLQNQQLLTATCKTPTELVAYMGAIQAQDYAMSRWAVGVRLQGVTDAQVQKAIDRGGIIRTHILRPTWHLVAAKDIRWMLELTAPHVRAAASTMYKKLELDAAIFKKSQSVIHKALQGGQQLTRSELMEILQRSKINTDDLRSTHLMFQAELDGLVCNGAMRGKQFTYALLDDRVPAAKAIPREEALAHLALRYFTSHGPATLPDFCWWSGLPVRDAKSGLEAVKPRLQNLQAGDHTYWFAPAQSPQLKKPLVRFLPAYDEFTISYKDRSAVLDPAFSGQAMTGNGIFKPIIVVNGKVEGVWKRSIVKDRLLVEAYFFKPPARPGKKAMEKALQHYSDFSGLEVNVI